MPENPRIEELRRRVQADPASIAFAALAEEYRRLGRHDEAVETCLAGLQRHPAYLSARVTLGRALVETGDLDSAREQFETVLRSAPENLAAIRGLAQIHERLGHSTEMDPHLAQLMREHAAAPPPPAPPQPVAAVPPPPVPEPPVVAVPVATREPEPPVVAAPVVAREPEPEPEPEVEPEPQFEPEPEPFAGLELGSDREPPLDLPLTSMEPLASVPFIEMPDPAITATIARLERFLDAIRHARHA